MKRLISIALCFMLVFALCPPVFAAGDTITWTGASSDNWDVAGNWDPAQVPVNGDNVIISGDSEVEYTSANISVTLNCAGDLTVSGGALTLTGDSFLTGCLLGAGDIIISDGVLQWSEGYIGGEAYPPLEETITVDANARLAIDTENDTCLERYLVNNGQVMLNNGELYLGGGGGGTGTFTASAGAYLRFYQGDYSFGGNFVNGGSLSIWPEDPFTSALSVSMNAGYRQENTGTLCLKVWGSEPGQFSRLDITGQAELSGILEVDFIDDYVPSLGNTFEIMTYGSRTGEFSSIKTNELGISLAPTYNDESLTLTVVADTTPPELISITPTNGAANASPGTDVLLLKFDEPVWGVNNTEVNVYKADGTWAHNWYPEYADTSSVRGNGTDTITLRQGNSDFRFKPGVSYYIIMGEGVFADKAENKYAGISDHTTGAFTIAGDTVPPTPPTGLQCAAKTSTMITLEWDASNDDCGPVGYDIYVQTIGGFALIGSTDTTTYTVIELGEGTFLNPNTPYTFMVCAVDGSSNQSAQSGQVTVTTEQTPNLIWEERTITPFTPGGGMPGDWIYYFDTCYGAGKYVAVGTYGTILTSADGGSTWQLEYGANFSDPSLKGITYGNDMFVAVGSNKIYTKTATGGDWAVQTIDLANFDDVTFGPGSGGNIFVAVGDQRNVSQSLYWSADGITWHECTPKPVVPAPGFHLTSVAADGKGRFVAVGYEEASFGESNTLLIWKSDNGKSWSKAGGFPYGQFNGVAYGSEAFIAVGGSVANAWISTNKGDSWKKGHSLSSCPTDIAWGDGVFVGACGKEIYASDNRGETWPYSWDLEEEVITSVSYHGGSFVATDAGGKIYQAVTAPATRPAAPQNFTARAGDGQVTLNWTAPASDGGAAIIRYEVSKDNGGTWVTASANTSHTFTGLTNGTEYTFKVRAVNSVGNGAEASVSATPAPTYTVTVTDGTGGTITASLTTAIAGETITLTITPDTGKRLKAGSLKYNDGTEDHAIGGSSFAMPSSNVTVTAEFEDNSIPVTDHDKVMADIAALSIGYAPEDSADAVTQDVILTVEGSIYRSIITWASSNTAVISDGGVVMRPGFENGDAAVTVTATVYNNEASPATKDFGLIVLKLPQITYTVTFDKNDGDTEASPATKEVISGGNVDTLPTAPIRSGYTFNGWNTQANGSGTSFTAATAITGSITVYAQWIRNSSGDSGGSTTPVEAPKTETKVEGNTATATTTVATAVDSNGNAAATVSRAQVSDAIGKAMAEAEKQGEGTAARIEIKVEASANATTAETSIPKEAVNQASEAGISALTVSTPVASITFGSNTLSALSKEAAGDLKITAAKVESSSLSPEAQRTVGDRPVFDFSVTSGDKTISEFGEDVSVSVPYTPKEGEDTDAIVIYYVNESGELEIVSDCLYDPATGRVSFSTRHFSQYAVGYNKANFKDVAERAWYSKAIGFIAAREITTGTDGGNFSPEAKLTRGQFIVMLMKAYSIAPDADPKNNFADAGATYYTDYLAAAKRLGITAGVGNNMFAPEKEITRQEMFTLLYNALKIIGRLPQDDSGKTLSDFTDAGQIDSWAKDAMTLLVETGTIGGNAGKLNPTSMTTRAEMAQVLYNLLSK